ncbi:hypothetical protein HETIRDRAFT_147294 [Heterobasidion irregulare TC 32-1]|uniref:Uncharacterized protein n=1 Tax=Heterobasidion irregulare (strain TC 32-1) TaxID=747525 RepID=W4K091_HETIT|nr:uncharacterized protein HETIRDRAFT_147294 [Heterobasidion irregulare TC 32-1]ETW78755.1 hypothetical protein HETIRDRAFT_147294 [Heterobasidion irregulare TC 32-1]
MQRPVQMMDDMRASLPNWIGSQARQPIGKPTAVHTVRVHIHTVIHTHCPAGAAQHTVMLIDVVLLRSAAVRIVIVG